MSGLCPVCVRSKNRQGVIFTGVSGVSGLVVTHMELPNGQAVAPIARTRAHAHWVETRPDTPDTNRLARMDTGHIACPVSDLDLTQT